MNASSTEIAAAIDGCFANGPATKDHLIDAAERSMADTPVMRALHQLPNIRYGSARELWEHLSHPSADINGPGGQSH